MLVLVVGPSGAGKDTLLQAAAQQLAHDRRIRFVRRVVTRPPGMVGEDYDSLTEQAFDAQREGGAFAFAWRAHGLQYGIPADIGIDIAEGRLAVANVSRAVIAEAAQRFPLRVIAISAPADILARRLAARGREDAVDLARRLARSIALPLPIEYETIVNDGTVEAGAKRLVDLLTRAASDAQPA